jgi:hypothetical protein
VVIAVDFEPVAVLRISTVAPATGAPAAVTEPRMVEVVSCAITGVASVAAIERLAAEAARKCLKCIKIVPVLVLSLETGLQVRFT